MTAEPTPPDPAAPPASASAAGGAAAEPAREKTGIPKNPGRRDLGMKVTLLFPDREIVERSYVPIIYTACRTCYSEEAPEEIFRRALAGDFDPVKMQKLISSVIESGHGSTIEHVVFTFAITGVSRTLSHQLVRHRAGVAFDQQSQRYVKFKGQADDAADTRSPRPTRPCASATSRRSRGRSSSTATCSRPVCPARTPGSCSRTRPGRTSS